MAGEAAGRSPGMGQDADVATRRGEEDSLQLSMLLDVVGCLLTESFSIAALRLPRAEYQLSGS